MKPPGLRVRSRSGFYGAPDEEPRPVLRSRDQQLLAALMSPFASGGMRLKLTSLFVNSARAVSFVQSLMHIDGRDVAFVPEDDGWHKAVLDILVVTFGEDGSEADRSNRTYTIRVRKDEYRKAVAGWRGNCSGCPPRKEGKMATTQRPSLKKFPEKTSRRIR